MTKLLPALVALFLSLVTCITHAQPLTLALEQFLGPKGEYLTFEYPANRPDEAQGAIDVILQSGYQRKEPDSYGFASAQEQSGSQCALKLIVGNFWVECYESQTSHGLLVRNMLDLEEIVRRGNYSDIPLMLEATRAEYRRISEATKLCEGALKCSDRWRPNLPRRTN